MKVKGTAGKPGEEQIDVMMDLYIAWRDQSANVEAKYRTWTSAPGHHRALAFDDYVQALDREEEAATEYRQIVELASRR